MEFVQLFLEKEPNSWFRGGTSWPTVRTAGIERAQLVAP